MIPKEINYDYLLAAFRRRFWYVIFPFFLVFMGTLIYCILVPKLYVSTALILIQPQEVPRDYVKSTVTTDIKARLSSITEQVMSRSKLEEIIDKYDLYREIRSKSGILAALEKMRGQIGINIKDDSRRRRSNQEPTAFEVSFEGADPNRVRNVTTDIANLFIDYNFRLRAEQAAGTLQFLDRELERMREALRQKEALVRQFKEKHYGSLPEQADQNLRILSQLQNRLDAIDRRMQGYEDRKFLLQAESSRLGALEPGVAGQKGTPATLEGLRQELQRLQSRYSDKHPDVVRIKRLIAAAEQREQAGVGDAADSSRATDAKRLIGGKRDNLSIKAQLMDKEMLALSQEREKTVSQIEDYRRRIEGTPQLKQQFVDLDRDYRQATGAYQSLLERKLQAEVAANLERTQKGEQLKILDPANLPQAPSDPNVLKLIAVGLVAAFGSGFGLAFLREFLDRAFWSRKEVEGVLAIPILATVPFIHTEKDRRRRRIRLAGAVCALCVMGSALLIALVILWKSGPGPIPS